MQQNYHSAVQERYVGLGHSVMQSFTSIGPMLDLIAVFPLVALFAGEDFPYAIIISFLVSFTTINTTYQLSRRFSTNGGYYSYAGKILGKAPGLFVALSYLAYSIIVLLAITSFAGYFIFESMLDFGISSARTIPFILSAVFIITVFAIVHLGLKKSLKFTLIAGTAEAAFIIVISLFMFLYPFAGSTVIFPPGNLNSNFLTGVIFGVLAFSGSGSSIFLSENSKNPKKTPADGLALAFLISGLIMIISSFAVVAFIGNYLTLYVNNPAALLADIQQKYGIIFLVPAILFLVLSAMNLSVSYLNALLKSVKKMFMDNVLYYGKGTGKNSATSVLLVAVITLILVLSVLYGPYNAFVYMSSLAGLFFISVHAFANVALVKTKGRVITTMFLPLVSLIFLAAVFTVSVWSFASEFPVIIYMYIVVMILISVYGFVTFTHKEYNRDIEFHVG
ncbi:MAG: hypothetical protein B2I17_07445 [Thermoplasmatales archaeon B_DKE]|nr:MAG: hypothetical protein B2I17_07445 [Thermoplasmatales archaeon B_DKE]